MSVTREQIAEAVILQITEILCLEDGSVHGPKELVELGADSLDMVELTMWAEQEYGIILCDDQVEAAKTVDAFIDTIGALL